MSPRFFPAFLLLVLAVGLARAADIPRYMPVAKQLNPGAWLPDDQLVAFGRYFFARYGAHGVWSCECRRRRRLGPCARNRYALTVARP